MIEIDNEALIEYGAEVFRRVMLQGRDMVGHDDLLAGELQFLLNEVDRLLVQSVVVVVIQDFLTTADQTKIIHAAFDSPPVRGKYLGPHGGKNDTNAINGFGVVVD